MHAICNDTKWNELRTSMLAIGDGRPRWRTKSLNGYISEWDGEWYYHFIMSSYSDIEWCEIKENKDKLIHQILNEIDHIGLYGEILDGGIIRVYGFIADTGKVKKLVRGLTKW